MRSGALPDDPDPVEHIFRGADRRAAVVAKQRLAHRLDRFRREISQPRQNLAAAIRLTHAAHQRGEVIITLPRG